MRKKKQTNRKVKKYAGEMTIGGYRITDKDWVVPSLTNKPEKK